MKFVVLKFYQIEIYPIGICSVAMEVYAIYYELGL